MCSPTLYRIWPKGITVTISAFALQSMRIVFCVYLEKQIFKRCLTRLLLEYLHAPFEHVKREALERFPSESQPRLGRRLLSSVWCPCDSYLLGFRLMPLIPLAPGDSHCKK